MTMTDIPMEDHKRAVPPTSTSDDIMRERDHPRQTSDWTNQKELNLPLWKSAALFLIFFLILLTGRHWIKTWDYIDITSPHFFPAQISYHRLRSVWKTQDLWAHSSLQYDTHNDQTERQHRTVSVAGNTETEKEFTRVLYIITALEEYNSGIRLTEKGQDRLKEVVLPLLVNGVQSMLEDSNNYKVDVYLILAYELKPGREQMIRDALPSGVGLETWDNAMPIGYDKPHKHVKVTKNSRALSRQHRYVVKDKLYDYDFFLAFEDDMYITGPHLSHFLEMTEHLQTLYEEAPEFVDDGPDIMVPPDRQTFFGPMSKSQVSRLIPGFIRVEVLIDESEYGAQSELDPIVPDWRQRKDGSEQHVDPKTCCHIIPRHGLSTISWQLPSKPAFDKIILWETGIKGLSLRKLPELKSQDKSPFDWVVLEPGPGKRLKEAELLGGYWSGRDRGFGVEEKPSPGKPDLIAQQGGWMATRQQILRMDRTLCTFLPPYELPLFRQDGQESNNVEFWSGGYQFFTGVKGGCNMQRVLSVEEDFSKHLIYHTSNNKQKQIPKQRLVKADTLLGQLSTVLKSAQDAHRKELVVNDW